jgi:hypothetical protein
MILKAKKSILLKKNVSKCNKAWNKPFNNIASKKIKWLYGSIKLVKFLNPFLAKT